MPRMGPKKARPGNRTLRVELTSDHLRLLDAFFGPAGGVVAEAARQAGMDFDTARRLMIRPPKAFRLEMERRQKLLAERHVDEITQDKLIAELKTIAFGDPRAVMKWGPEGLTLLDSEGLKPEDAGTVQEVSETHGTEKGGGSIKLKRYDKLKAIELLGRLLGFDKSQKPEAPTVNNTVNVAVQVNAVQDEIEGIFGRVSAKYRPPAN